MTDNKKSDNVSLYREDTLFMNMYTTDDGDLKWENIHATLVDVSESYLMTIEGIDYENATGDKHQGILRQLAGERSADIDEDVLGSRLLKGLSKMVSIILERTAHGKDEAFVLHRLSKFSPIVSKLSDEYAMKDRMYQSQWHDDVLGICELFVAKNREVNTDG